MVPHQLALPPPAGAVALALSPAAAEAVLPATVALIESTEPAEIGVRAARSNRALDLMLMLDEREDEKKATQNIEKLEAAAAAKAAKMKDNNEKPGVETTAIVFTPKKATLNKPTKHLRQQRRRRQLRLMLKMKILRPRLRQSFPRQRKRL
jgi:hypothetical protein